jgi:hypothetical protein
MPKAATASKGTKKDKPERGNGQQSKEREVLYPTLELFVYDSTGKKGTGGCITADQAKEWLKWETQEEYRQRKAKEGVDITKEDPVPPRGWTLKDYEGNNVVCWNSVNNREIRENHCYRLAQDHLNRVWAGPLNMPGETINGESVILGRTGLVLSANHRLIALVLAYQKWASEKEKHHWQAPEFWPVDKFPDGPLMESVVVKGVSESHVVVRTLDNVLPRSLADIIYTSPLFDDLPQAGKAKCSRMMQAAVKLLWERTKPKDKKSGAVDIYTGFLTHSQAEEFINRHKRITQAVRILYELDVDPKHANAIHSTIGLGMNAGECAALLYLMAAGETSEEDYRGEDQEPSEKGINWGEEDSNWEYACEFWKALAAKQLPGDSLAVHKALERVSSEEFGGSTNHKKFAVLSMAWSAFKEEGKVMFYDLFDEYDPKEHISTPKGYEEDKDGHLQLAPDARSDFGGIDLGDQVREKANPDEPSEEEKKQIQERKEGLGTIEERLANLRAKGKKKEAVQEEPMDEDAPFGGGEPEPDVE